MADNRIRDLGGPPIDLAFGGRAILPRHHHELSWLEIVADVVGLRGDPRRQVTEFLKQFLRVPCAELMPSGRAAVYWALRARPEQEVYIPAYTCYVVVEAALLAGKKVRFIDVDPETYNMTPEDLAGVIRPGGIVLATHQFGLPCRIEDFMDLAHRHGCLVLEDAAGALGGKLGDRPLGSFGDLAILSFEGTKTASAWTAGALVGRDEEWFAHACRLWRQEGDRLAARPLPVATILAYPLVTSPQFYGRLILPWLLRRHGLTSGTPTASAILTDRYLLRPPAWQVRMVWRGLNRLETIGRRRREIWNRYQQVLAGCPAFTLPTVRSDADLLPIRFPIRLKGIPKRKFYQGMLDHGVDLGFSFNYLCPPAEDQECFPRARRLAEEVVNLPFYTAILHRLNRVTHAALRAARDSSPLAG